MQQDAVRAVDGRQPGARGLATRARLLACTEDLLTEQSYRDLTAIDIARECGTSPATFYQYFPDVESAVLVLAGQMAGEHASLSQIVRSADWADPAAAHDAARGLAAGFVAFWVRHRSILRVVDLGSAEGDPRFRGLRTELLNDVTNALAEAVLAVSGGRSGAAVSGGRSGAAAAPMAVGAVLVSMLSHVAAHRDGLAAWGIATADIEAVMASIVYRTVTDRVG